MTEITGTMKLNGRGDSGGGRPFDRDNIIGEGLLLHSTRCARGTRIVVGHLLTLTHDALMATRLNQSNPWQSPSSLKGGTRGHRYCRLTFNLDIYLVAVVVLSSVDI